MRRLRVGGLVPFSFCFAVATAQGVVYVTDLAIFTMLAPCAASALSENIMSQTYSNCPEAVTELQSCVCTKNQNFASISSKVSSSVSYTCGSTASDDQASAMTVLSAYCNQANLPSFPTPSVKLSQYITDLPAFSALAPCAAGALSYAVQSMTYYYCPPEASLLAPCVCGKNQNSLKVSQIINSSVKYSCASHNADITSAQAIFAGYCNQLAGTTSFPTPSNPPGDMTYYITALPQYSALAPCAKSGLSYAIQSQTRDYCPGGPQALASCVCIKESMSLFASSIINTEVKYSCSSTATEDVASAQDVFAFYCSAASNLVKAVGVTESVAQTYPTAKAGTGSGAGGSQPTSGAGSDGKDRSRSPSNALIAGAVGGVIAVLGLIGIAIFLVRKKAKERREREQQAQVLNDLSGNPPNNGGLGVPSTGQQAPFGQHPNSPPPDYYGKAELPSSNSTGIAAAAAIGKPPPSPAPSNGGATRPHTSGGATTGGNVSPVSAYSTLNNNGLPNHPELPATNVPPVPYPPNQAELAGGVPAGGHPSATSPSNHQYNSPYAPPPPPNRAELPPGQPTYNQPPLFTAYGHPQPPPAVAGAAEMYAGPPGTAVHEVPGSSGYPQPPQQAWGGYQQPGAQPQQQHEWGGQQQYNQGRPQWQQPWQQHQRIYEAPNTTATGYGDRPAELQGAMGYQSGPVPQSYTAELDGWGSGRNGGSGVAYAR